MALMWLLATSAGMMSLVALAGRAGPQGDVPAQWPAETSLPLDSERWTLLMFLHPKCPCSRASVAELARLMAVGEPRVRAVAMMLQPQGQADSWADPPGASLWRRAQAIPGVRVERDVDGREANRFGARTSGHTLLFDRDGRLRFSGGITVARGHEGDNAGRTMIDAMLRGRCSTSGPTPVFGCDLLQSDRGCAAEDQACHP